MTTPKHTPTPWINKIAAIYDKAGSSIGHIHYAPDAAFIVRACNNFDSLVERLSAHVEACGCYEKDGKRFYKQYGELGAFGPGSRRPLEIRCYRCGPDRAALQKAREAK